MYAIMALPTLGQTSDFNALLNTVVDNNLSIKASESSIESEILTLKSENNLSDPELEFSHLWGEGAIGNKIDAGVSQSFDWPGVYHARNKAISSASKAIDFLRQSNYLDKKLEIKLLFIDIINANKKFSLINEQLNNTNDLIVKYNAAYKNGELTILDINKLKLEQIKLKATHASIQAQLSTLNSSLQSLNGGKDCTEIFNSLTDYPGDAILSIDSYRRMVTEMDPTLQYNSMSTQRQIHQVNVEKMKRLPSFSIGYRYNNELGTLFNGISMSMSIPLFSSRNKVKASEALSNALRISDMDVSAKQLSSLLSSRAKAITLQQQLNEYNNLLDDNQYLDILHKALDGGELSILDYINEVNYYLDACQSRLDLEYEFHTTLTILNKYLLLHR